MINEVSKLTNAQKRKIHEPKPLMYMPYTLMFSIKKGKSRSHPIQPFSWPLNSVTY